MFLLLLDGGLSTTTLLVRYSQLNTAAARRITPGRCFCSGKVTVAALDDDSHFDQLKD